MLDFENILKNKFFNIGQKNDGPSTTKSNIKIITNSNKDDLNDPSKPAKISDKRAIVTGSKVIESKAEHLQSSSRQRNAQSTERRDRQGQKA